MIDKSTYLSSLAKLEEKEKLKTLAIENGKNFLNQYKNALQQAEKEKKHIFLLFYMPGCDGCNVLKYILENNEEIKKHLDKYIILYCDVSNSRTNLNQKYNLYSYPAYFIIDHQEKILKQKIGILVNQGPEKHFINWLLYK